VHAVFYAQNGVSFIDCLRMCKANAACVSIFWFGDETDHVITCRLVSIPVKDALRYEYAGLKNAFVFSDRDCPLVDDPGY
jgi:hypothetical protein